jgi:hypothetical protein
MKYISMFAVLLIVILVAPLSAQEDIDAVREGLRAEKKALVTKNMQLTESEASAFWPIYDEFQVELNALGDRMVKLIETYGVTRNVMSDETAANILGEFMSIQADRVKLQEEYLPQFEKVLPMIKVVRYYQIENKFRVAVDYDITSKIPLVE